jgi:hypothetical protein
LAVLRGGGQGEEDNTTGGEEGVGEGACLFINIVIQELRTKFCVPEGKTIIKLSLRLIKHHAMRTQEGVEV